MASILIFAIVMSTKWKAVLCSLFTSDAVKCIDCDGKLLILGFMICQVKYIGAMSAVYRVVC